MTAPGPARLTALAALVAVATACASTTYDESVDTVVTVATTTTLPQGTAAELLPMLAGDAAALSGIMVAEGDADSAVERIRQLWDTVRDEVTRDRPELLGDFEANVARCESAVQFRRAADADKAATNLDALVTAYLA